MHISLVSFLAIVGWMGTFIYLINHAYLSFMSQSNRTIYYSLNLIAALSLVASSFYIASWQALFVNLFWALISLAMVFKLPLEGFRFNKVWFYGILSAVLLVFVAVSVWNLQINISILAWASVIVFSVAYLLFSTNVISQREYLLWNMYAAFTLLPELWRDDNYPVFFLEVVWGIISLYGAIKMSRHVHLLDLDEEHANKFGK